MRAAQNAALICFLLVFRTDVSISAQVDLGFMSPATAACIPRIRKQEHPLSH